MRDAAELERRGIATVVLVNDVFRPIAEATAAILGLPDHYTSRAVVYLLHPTSMLSRDRIWALIDERWDELLAKLTGRPTSQAGAGAAEQTPIAQPVEAASRAVEAFAESLRADGAELRLEGYRDGVLEGRLDVVDANACANGTCVLPRPQLEAMIAALARAVLPDLRAVRLADARERVGSV